MIAGDRVRVRSAPDRVGVLTADVQIIGDSSRWLVQFPDREQRFPESNLELVSDNESIESLLDNGSYGRAVCS